MIAETVTNADLFLWALFDVGGSDRFVDVEEVFLRTFALAPQRLSWRTRADLPDLKKCSKALRDAEAKTPRLLVKQGSDSRRLTVEGQKWIEEHFDRLALALGGPSGIQPPRQRLGSKLVADALRSDAFQSWSSTKELQREKWRFAELLRCSPDSAKETWRNRLETLRGAAYASSELDLLGFLEELAAQHRDWFA